jgi:hypothetical protein
VKLQWFFVYLTGSFLTFKQEKHQHRDCFFAKHPFLWFVFIPLQSFPHSQASDMAAPTHQLPTSVTVPVAKWDSRYAGHVPHDASYYFKCALGGVLACGLTHAAICPLDVTKCNMQVSSSIAAVFSA